MELVAGVRGPVGRHLVEALVAGTEVRAWDGTQDLDAAMAGAEVAYACAPGPDATLCLRGRSSPSPELKAVVEAAARGGVRRLVHLSTSQVYGPPLAVPSEPFSESSPPRPVGALARLARQDEKWLLGRRHGLEVVIVRAAHLFGPGQPVTEALLEEIRAARLRLPDRGWAAQTFIHPADAARALQAASRRGRPGGVYLAAGFTDTWHGLCADLAASCGLPLRIGTVPYGLAYALAAARELQSQPGARCFPSRELVDMFARPHVLDDSTSRRDLTWSPQVGSFEEGRQYLPPHRRRPGEVAQPVSPATSQRGRSRF